MCLDCCECVGSGQLCNRYFSAPRNCVCCGVCDVWGHVYVVCVMCGVCDVWGHLIGVVCVMCGVCDVWCV